MVQHVGLLQLWRAGLLSPVLSGLLPVGLLLLQSSGLRMQELQQCDTPAQLLWGMWDLPGPGVEPMSPALQVES